MNLKQSYWGKSTFFIFFNTPHYLVVMVFRSFYLSLTFFEFFTKVFKNSSVEHLTQLCRAPQVLYLFVCILFGSLKKTCFLSNITIFVFTVLDIFRTDKQTRNLGKIYAARCCVRLQAPRLFLDRTLLLCLCRFFIPGLKFTTCSKLICFFQLINFIISFIIISSCDKKYFYHYNPWFLLLSFKRTNQVI